MHDLPVNSFELGGAQSSEVEVKALHLKNFTAFDDLKLEFSPRINVLLGENGTGKTHVLKLLYSALKAAEEVKLDAENKGLGIEPKRVGMVLEQKLTGVFRPERLGRLVHRSRGRTESQVELRLSNNNQLKFKFGSQEKTEQIRVLKRNLIGHDINKPIFIPTKEVLSIFKGFREIYSQYVTSFSEVYYDLAVRLGTPLSKGPTDAYIKNLLKPFGELGLKVSLDEKNGQFKVHSLGRNLEASLASEGIRKIASLIHLIKTGGLNSNSVLFWDEPEANLNPKWTEAVVKMLFTLANDGVQIFLASHDYLLIRLLSLESEFRKEKRQVPDILFHNFLLEPIPNGKGKKSVSVESSSNILDFERIPVLDYYQAFFKKERAYFTGKFD